MGATTITYLIYMLIACFGILFICGCGFLIMIIYKKLKKYCRKNTLNDNLNNRLIIDNV